VKIVSGAQNAVCAMKTIVFVSLLIVAASKKMVYASEKKV
jgi:hypothetical protein